MSFHPPIQRTVVDVAKISALRWIEYIRSSSRLLGRLVVPAARTRLPLPLVRVTTVVSLLGGLVVLLAAAVAPVAVPPIPFLVPEGATIR